MQSEHEDANCECDQSNSGGAAPEHRRCQYLKADGKQCRDWGVRGQDFCYRHGVFLQPGGRRQIDVPLLEDESSIVLVLSATLRALACGAIPVNNGRLILDGCRLAHTMHLERQKAAGHRVQRGHKCSCAEKMGEESSEARAESTELNPDCGARHPEPSAQPAEPCALRSESCEDAAPASESHTPQNRRLRRLEKNWNRQRSTVESVRTDSSDAPSGAGRQEYLAAQAAPLEERMEEEALVGDELIEDELVGVS